MENFSLSEIPKKFVLADFQRKQNTAHVYRIVESIVNNKFYDNIIRCVRLKNKQYEVIDGQHRLKALWILHKQYGVMEYTIVMQLFNTDEAREVFRKINSGKKLTTADHLKTLDDGTFTFFDDLRGVCTHTANKTMNTYINAVNALFYAMTHVSRPVKPYQLEDVLESFTSDDIAHVYRISVAMKKVYDKTMTPRVFNLNLAKSVLRLGYEHNLTSNEYVRLLTEILRSNEIMQLVLERFTIHEKELNKMIRNVWTLYGSR